jgi:hypothetical protein
MPLSSRNSVPTQRDTVPTQTDTVPTQRDTVPTQTDTGYRDLKQKHGSTLYLILRRNVAPPSSLLVL